MFTIKAQPFDTMLYLYSSVQMPLIRCRVGFSEKLEPDRLKQTINQLVLMYPILGCKFDINRRRWVKQSFHQEDYLSVLSVTHNGNEEEQALLYTLKIENDPPIKMFLVRHESSDTLCIVVSHILCDGMGFIKLLYLLADIYSNPLLQDEDVPVKILQRLSFRQVLQGISLREKVRIMKNKSIYSAKDTLHAIPLTGSTDVPFLAVRSIDQDAFLALRSYAKQHNASMNDVILTAYIWALYTQFGWTDITLPCPVDLRRFSKNRGENDICNLTGNYFCHAEITKDTSFEDILRTISTQMKAQKTSYDCLKGPIQYHLFYHLLPFRLLRKIFFLVSPVPVTSYTNLGVIDRNRLCFSQAEVKDAYIVTATKQPPYFQVSVSTFDNKCTLTSCVYADNSDQQIVSSLLDAIIKELKIVDNGNSAKAFNI